MGELRRWKRLEGHTDGDYHCLNTCSDRDRWEGICYVALRDVWFRGFGMFTSWVSRGECPKTMGYRVKWVIDSEESDTHEI